MKAAPGRPPRTRAQVAGSHRRSARSIFAGKTKAQFQKPKVCSGGLLNEDQNQDSPQEEAAEKRRQSDQLADRVPMGSSGNSRGVFHGRQQDNQRGPCARYPGSPARKRFA